MQSAELLTGTVQCRCTNLPDIMHLSGGTDTFIDSYVGMFIGGGRDDVDGGLLGRLYIWGAAARIRRQR